MEYTKMKKMIRRKEARKRIKLDRINKLKNKIKNKVQDKMKVKINQRKKEER